MSYDFTTEFVLSELKDVSTRKSAKLSNTTKKWLEAVYGGFAAYSGKADGELATAKDIDALGNYVANHICSIIDADDYKGTQYRSIQLHNILDACHAHYLTTCQQGYGYQAVAIPEVIASLPNVAKRISCDCTYTVLAILIDTLEERDLAVDWIKSTDLISGVMKQSLNFRRRNRDLSYHDPDIILQVDRLRGLSLYRETRQDVLQRYEENFRDIIDEADIWLYSTLHAFFPTVATRSHNLEIIEELCRDGLQIEMVCRTIGHNAKGRPALTRAASKTSDFSERNIDFISQHLDVPRADLEVARALKRGDGRALQDYGIELIEAIAMEQIKIGNVTHSQVSTALVSREYHLDDEPSAVAPHSR